MTPKSKLLLLAKSRAAASASKSTSASNKSLSILDGLKGKVPSHQAQSQGKLALKSQLGLGLTPRLRKRKIEDVTKKSGFDTHTPIELSLPQPATKSPVEPSFNVVFDDSNLLKLAKTSLSTFLFSKESEISEVESNKRRRLTHFKDIFEPITNHEVNNATAKKIQLNFNEPSPDQKILDAQKTAFEENMSGLSLKSKAEPTRTSNPALSSSSGPVLKATKPFKKIDIENSVSHNEYYQKPNKSFVVIGHVDAGKSTLLGRILYDVGAVDGKTLNKLTREAEKAGKGSFALAWIMDQTTEERSRGVTVDICATHFETKTTRFTAIDAPGHKDFVPQTISGLTQANYAVVVIDSISGEFESGFNMDGQTKEHTLLARFLGIEKIIVVVNKMDKENWSRERFEEIKFQMTEFLTNPENDVSFKAEQVEFIPLSGLTGNNLVKRDESIKGFEWYKGPTLIGYLDLLPQDKEPVNQLVKDDFHLTINDVFEPSGSEFVVTGKVLSGVIQPGESILITPLNEGIQIQSISVNDKTVDFAMSGEVALLKFKSNQLNNVISGKITSSILPGDMIVKLDESVIQASDKFECEIKLFSMKKPLLIGTPFVIFRNNCHSLARITKILEIQGATKKKKMHLVSKQVARVEIQCDRLLPMTTYDQNHTVGRIVLRREGFTIGAGKITNTIIATAE